MLVANGLPLYVLLPLDGWPPHVSLLLKDSAAHVLQQISGCIVYSLLPCDSTHAHFAYSVWCEKPSAGG